ncbi:hypothetical protein Thermo_00531 [Thermoplasmatales archaeon]|nr:hypothetical protein Thermo_00531 [Thermoplasmatales archaeon]
MKELFGITIHRRDVPNVSDAEELKKFNRNYGNRILRSLRKAYNEVKEFR